MTGKNQRCHITNPDSLYVTDYHYVFVTIKQRSLLKSSKIYELEYRSIPWNRSTQLNLLMSKLYAFQKDCWGFLWLPLFILLPYFLQSWANLIYEPRLHKIREEQILITYSHWLDLRGYPTLRTKVGRMHGGAPRVAEGDFPVWDLSVN